MEQVNIFEQAVRQQIMFPSSRGPLLPQQLWQIPMTSKDEFNLDSVARAVSKELKAQAEESFVTVSNNPKKKELELKLEILVYVIRVRQEEITARENLAARKAEAEKIKEIINRKQNAALEGESLEMLNKRLADLNATK